MRYMPRGPSTPERIWVPLFFIPKFKFPEGKQPIRKVEMKIYCQFYLDGMTLTRSGGNNRFEKAAIRCGRLISPLIIHQIFFSRVTRRGQNSRIFLTIVRQVASPSKLRSDARLPKFAFYVGTFSLLWADKHKFWTPKLLCRLSSWKKGIRKRTTQLTVLFASRKNVRRQILMYVFFGVKCKLFSALAVRNLSLIVFLVNSFSRNTSSVVL